MQDCRSFTCCLSWIYISMSKCTSLIVFCRYYFDCFGICSFEHILVYVWYMSMFICSPLSYFRGRSSRYSKRFHNFSVIIPRCLKNVYVNIFLSWHTLGFSANKMLSFGSQCQNGVIVSEYFVLRRTINCR